MAYDEALAARVRGRMGDREGLSERKMFGGLSFMLGGNLCVGIIGNELVVRVDPGEAEALLDEPHVRRFDMTGRPMRGWLVVGAGGIADDRALARWLERAVAFASRLPVKA